MNYGVIIYGPPAAGKNTITEQLRRIDSRYELFPRLKAGGGRTAGYRMTTESAIEALRTGGQVVWENRRYDSTYVVDRPYLVERLAECFPVVHLGQLEAVEAVAHAVAGTRWLSVYVWCSRMVAEERIRLRQTGDIAARLQAWDETEPARDSEVNIDSGQILPHDAAQAIHTRFLSLCATSS